MNRTPHTRHRLRYSRDSLAKAPLAAKLRREGLPDAEICRRVNRPAGWLGVMVGPAIDRPR